MNPPVAVSPLRRAAIVIWAAFAALLTLTAVAAAAQVKTHRPRAQARAHGHPVQTHPVQTHPVQTHPVPALRHPVVPQGAAAHALAARRAAAASRRAATSLHLQRATARAHMAGDPAVSMVDFSFAPGSTTVHVGDTITWTNNGKQAHSATANNHSFDTGLLRTGQSASHTFTTAGTFTYFCIVHPYMHGTVIVLAATTTTTTTPSTTTPTTTTPSATTAATTTPQATGPTLPVTGADDLGAFAIGLLLVGAGCALRIRVRARSSD